MKKKYRHLLILFIWIVLWQLAAWAIHNKIIFVGPLEVLRALAGQIGAAGFWSTILFSFSRIALGFLSAFVTGILLAAAGSRFPWLREFLEPFISLLQSVPVASFVILALIWIGSVNLSVLITFLVVFPVIYRNVLEGIGHTDRSLLEMARVFRLRPLDKLLYIFRPALMPYLQAGCRVALGLAWKSGVAAEVIGVPGHSIGEKLYMAKIYLETADLFAWTLVIILVSKLCETLFLLLLDRLGQAHVPSEACRAEAVKQGSPSPIQVKDIRKSYQGKAVLSDMSLALEDGRIYCLTGPSGCGKTTFLRILMGLEQPDQGTVTGLGHKKISAVFQEDRLCGSLSGIQNVALAIQKQEKMADPEDLLWQLLDPDSCRLPVSHLSGGMKRRVAVARALASSSDVIFMDEPFTGLDDAARERTIRIILKYRMGRTLLLVTHQEEDARRLQGELIRMSDGRIQ